MSGIGTEAEQFLLPRNWKSRFDSTNWSRRPRPKRRSVELYTASRLTIDPDSRAERGYLDLLAGRLQLPDALVDHVEATVSAVKTPPSVPSVPAANSPW